MHRFMKAGTFDIAINKLSIIAITGRILETQKLDLILHTPPSYYYDYYCCCSISSFLRCRLRRRSPRGVNSSDEEMSNISGGTDDVLS